MTKTDETKTIQLRYPVKADGATIEQLTMRRPLVKDLHAAQRAGAGAAETEVALFANLCEVTPETLDEMDLGDYRRLQGAYDGFLSHGSTSAAPEPS